MQRVRRWEEKIHQRIFRTGRGSCRVETQRKRWRDEVCTGEGAAEAQKNRVSWKNINVKHGAKFADF